MAKYAGSGSLEKGSLDFVANKIQTAFSVDLVLYLIPLFCYREFHLSFMAWKFISGAFSLISG